MNPQAGGQSAGPTLQAFGLPSGSFPVQGAGGVQVSAGMECEQARGLADPVDTLLSRIIVRPGDLPVKAASGRPAESPTSKDPAADFKKLARLRPVSRRFNQLALQVEGVVCVLNAARTMDARLLFFLQEAEDLRRMNLICKRKGTTLMTISGGLLAGALNSTPKLERFRLTYGDLGNEADELTQQLFRALSRCPLLKSIELVRCRVPIWSPVRNLTPFLHLKALALTNSLSITRAAMDHLLHQVAPALEKLTIRGLCGVASLRVESQTLTALVLDNATSNEILTKLEIDTPRLKRLHLPDSRETCINAPELCNLHFQRAPEGPIHGSTPWKVRELRLSNTWKEEPFLQVLQLSRDLEILDLEDVAFENSNIEKAAEILMYLRRLKTLDTSIRLLEALVDQSSERIVSLSFRNLLKLVVDATSMEEVHFCVKIAEASQVLTHLKIDLRGVNGPLVNMVTSFLNLQKRKPRLTIVVEEPRLISIENSNN
ncbi:hypothetical protein KFL_000340090 [Klebsormidium nitens]|uniref:Uncharacterized protein n=1 Tax=Klebsormidium nitens TaxID=105231 RepID=A0A1Y1HSS1_KLENI|nr:hypothetical protein KFL_000340090 [Klebsormidium nitens]|eukprot:GAQ79606.1 hypothetical protein KFL_000340090 [Klebsormidium nitens]